MRITGGKFRSRLLSSPRGDATRPTSDRVREALFGTLASRGFPADARVLDLFAGTGSLGLEALSRGATHVTFVEERRETVRALEENRAALQVGGDSQLFADKVERVVPRLPTASFDLVFLDPPYKLVTETAFASFFTGLARVLAPEALVILEHASRDLPPPLGALLAAETRRYGDTSLSFFEIPSDVAQVLRFGASPSGDKQDANAEAPETAPVATDL